MEYTPHIIALQEVKPKNYKYEKSAQEYSIEGYEIVKQNLCADEGKGLLLYAREGVVCNNIQLETNYSEHRSIKLKCGNESVHITSVYRSPNSSDDNNTKLLQLLQEISDKEIK